VLCSISIGCFSNQINQQKDCLTEWGLALSQVFDALSYYLDHQAEINKYIECSCIPDQLIAPRGWRSMTDIFIPVYLN
jgi:hypothetical protein